MSEDVKLIKEKECIRCKKFFVCNGKPKKKPCVNYEELKKNGKQENVYDEDM